MKSFAPDVVKSRVTFELLDFCNHPPFEGAGAALRGSSNGSKVVPITGEERTN